MFYVGVDPSGYRKRKKGFTGPSGIPFLPRNGTTTSVRVVVVSHLQFIAESRGLLGVLSSYSPFPVPKGQDH